MKVTGVLDRGPDSLIIKQFASADGRESRPTLRGSRWVRKKGDSLKSWRGATIASSGRSFLAFHP